MGAALDGERVSDEVIGECRGRRSVLLHEVREAEVAGELLQEVLRREGLRRPGARVHHVGREAHCAGKKEKTMKRKFNQTGIDWGYCCVNLATARAR